MSACRQDPPFGEIRKSKADYTIGRLNLKEDFMGKKRFAKIEYHKFT